jgi:hypothetical protein
MRRISQDSFEQCRQNARAKKLLQEHEEDRRGEDALQEERWLHQCAREREREILIKDKMDSVN